MVDVARGRYAAWSGVLAYVRREILTVPNTLTAFRLIAGIVIFIQVENLHLVFALALLGALSDAVDGPIARILGQETAFGKKFDQITDFGFGFALVYAIGSIGLTWYNIPVGVAIVAFSVGMAYLRITDWSTESSELSKQRIALQFTSAILIIMAYAFPKEDSVVVITVGYMGLWASMYLMWETFVGYLRKPD